MTDITAVILSAKPVEREIPGVVVLPFISRFNNAAGLLASRFAAIERVTTPWFFFLDDDDELPSDYMKVLDLCMAVETPLAYTDEIITNANGTWYKRESSPYSEQKFIEQPLLIHHLAVCRTDAAKDAMKVVPRGYYMVENLLYFQIAKNGATYINEIGYLWHRRDTGLHRHPNISMSCVRSSTWAYQNRKVVK